MLGSGKFGPRLEEKGALSVGAASPRTAGGTAARLGAARPPSREEVLSFSDAVVRKAYGDWLQKLESFEELEIVVDESDGVIWSYMAPKSRPSVTPTLAKESLEFQQSLRELYRALEPSGLWPFRYMVWGSKIPGIFNLGGDLRLFASFIRDSNRDSLIDYALACVAVVYENYVSMDLPVVTVSLVEGDALGGGLEAAISGDFVVAERSAKFGLPEVLFNLFPGMGAYSIIARRIGAKSAERMIMSGKVYQAEDLYELGLVDLLVEDGQGHEALFDYMQQNSPRHKAHLSIYGAGRRVNPLTLEELQEVAMTWVDTAMTLSESDLKKMERLAAAQDRRRRLTTAGS